MRWQHWNRRMHLYLGLGLLPWFLLYCVSAVPFSHQQYFDEAEKAKGLPQWILLREVAFHEPPPSGEELRPFARRMLAASGLEQEYANPAYGAYRQGPNQINLYVYSFWRSTQAKYFVDQGKLVVEDHRFRWDHFLTGMHAKGGFENGGLHNAWAWVVDLVCLALVAWVVSGLVMWWRLPAARVRRWGWVALGSGCVTFLLFLWRL